MVFNKEQFLTEVKKEFKTEEVEVGEGKLLLSEIESNDFMALWSNHKDEKGDVEYKSFLPALIAASIVNEDGTRMFTDEEFKDVRIPQTLMQKIGEIAKKLNGMNADEVKNESKETQEVAPTGE